MQTVWNKIWQPIFYIKWLLLAMRLQEIGLGFHILIWQWWSWWWSLGIRRKLDCCLNSRLPFKVLSTLKGCTSLIEKMCFLTALELIKGRQLSRRIVIWGGDQKGVEQEGTQAVLLLCPLVYMSLLLNHLDDRGVWPLSFSFWSSRY